MKYNVTKLQGSMVKVLQKLFLGIVLGLQSHGCIAMQVAVQVIQHREIRKQYNRQLLQAVHDGSIQDVCVALQAGADINAADKKKYTVLMFAIVKRHNAIARLLIDSRAYLETKDLLHRACLKTKFS